MLVEAEKLDDNPGAPAALYVALVQKMSSPEAQTEAILNELMVLARHNRQVHDEAATYFRNRRTRV
jgi:hypothetical protein